MASEGPLFPGTVTTLSNAGTSENANDWLTPGNISADDAAEAQITAATYDSPDISFILIGSNFGFTNVTGTVDGITVEIDRRSIIASSGVDFRVQLATGTAFANLVGTNKASATVWPTTSAIATYGGVADTWTASLTAAQVKAAGFAVFLSVSANIANADIGVDFIRVTVNYTSAPITVTPGTASLTTTRLTPTVTVSDNKTAVPGTASLSLTAFAPTVTVTGGGTTVTPGTASLSLTAFTPTVLAPRVVTPGTASLTTARFAPTVLTPRLVTPGLATLVTARFAPTVTVAAGVTVTPGTVSLIITRFAPTVTTAAAGTPLEGGPRALVHGAPIMPRGTVGPTTRGV